MKEVKAGGKAAQLRELREKRFAENTARLQEQLRTAQRSAPVRATRFSVPVKKTAKAPVEPDEGEWRDLEAEAREKGGE